MKIEKAPISFLCAVFLFIFVGVLARIFPSFFNLVIYDTEDNLNYFLEMWVITFLALLIGENIYARRTDGDSKDFQSAFFSPLIPLAAYGPLTVKSHNIFGLFITPLDHDKGLTILYWIIYVVIAIALTIIMQLRVDINTNALRERAISSIVGYIFFGFCISASNAYAAHQSLTFILYDESDYVKYFFAVFVLYMFACVIKEAFIRFLGKKISLQEITSDVIFAIILVYVYTAHTVESANIFGYGHIDNFSTACRYASVYYLVHSLITEFLGIKFVRESA